MEHPVGAHTTKLRPKASLDNHDDLIIMIVEGRSWWKFCFIP